VIASVAGAEGGDLAADVRARLEAWSPPSEVRRLMEAEPGHDPTVWRELAEAGLLGLHVPEARGGAGRSWVELAAVLEETGAALLCAPILSSVGIAASTVLASGDAEASEALLPAIARGERLVTVAVAEDDGRWEEASVATAATREASSGGDPEWRLAGHKSHVVDATVADTFLVAARGPDGVGIFVVDGVAPGLRRTPLPTVDTTRRQARLELHGTPARRLEGASFASLVDIACVALACEAVGGARRCLEAAVAHARQRIQFGRPIGSFQAVAHRCAEMLVDLECARGAARKAAEALATGDPEIATLAPTAKVACTEAFARGAAANIQIHGGTGFTWDCDAHLYFKRARSSQLLFGDPRHHREVLARRLGW